MAASAFNLIRAKASLTFSDSTEGLGVESWSVSNVLQHGTLLNGTGGEFAVAVNSKWLFRAVCCLDTVGLRMVQKANSRSPVTAPVGVSVTYRGRLLEPSETLVKTFSLKTDNS